MVNRLRVRRARLRACVIALAGVTLLSSQLRADDTITYSYDGRGRLIKVSHAGTAANNGAAASYTYDAADNRTKVAVTTSAGSSTCNGVSFSIASNGPVTEGATSAFTVTKSGTTPSYCSVNYATANGSATAGSDYSAESGTLTFAPTDTSHTANVPTVDDSVVEGTETFSMALSLPTAGATLGTPSSATATINDNDVSSPCTGVTFTIASNGAVTEGANSVFTVTKHGTATGSCTVNYATASGTATSGSDFTATSGTLTFTSGQTSQSVNVPTTDDSVVESAETFTMALSSPTGGSALGTPSSATATINDNDGVQPPVANPDYASTTACGSVTTNVVANDTDPGGNTPLQVTAIVSSTKGNATIIGTTSIEFDAIVASGTGSVTYTVTNTKGASANGTLTVTINGGVCP